MVLFASLSDGTMLMSIILESMILISWASDTVLVCFIDKTYTMDMGLFLGIQALESPNLAI